MRVASRRLTLQEWMGLVGFLAAIVALVSLLVRAALGSRLSLTILIIIVAIGLASFLYGLILRLRRIPELRELPVRTGDTSVSLELLRPSDLAIYMLPGSPVVGLLRRRRRTISIIAVLTLVLGLAAALLAFVTELDASNETSTSSSSPSVPTSLATSTTTAVTATTISTSVAEQPSVPSTAAPLTSATVVESSSSPSTAASNDTPAGTVLEIGKHWRHDGIELAVNKVDYSTSPSAVEIYFQLFNETASDQLITFGPGNFVISDNRGVTYPIGRICRNQSGGTDISESFDDRFVEVASGHFISIPSGEVDDQTLIGGCVTRLFVPVLTLKDPGVTEFRLVAQGLAGVDRAAWRLPVEGRA